MSSDQGPHAGGRARWTRVLTRGSFAPLLVALLLLMTLSELIVGVAIYGRLRTQLEQDLARRLVHVSRLIARGLDADTLVQFREGDETLVAYQLVRRKLEEQAEAAGVDRVYVVDPDLRTLVDSAADGAPGRLRVALLAQGSEADAALAGRAAATRLYAGEDGRLRLTALAPANGSAGGVRVLVGVDASPSFFESLGALRRRMLALGLAGVVIAGLFGALLLHQMAQRLERLRRATQRASSGDLSARADVAPGDPIGALGRDLDALIASIVATRDYYESVLGGLDVGLIVTGPEGALRIANVRAAQLLALPELAPGSDLIALVAGEPELQDFAARALAGRRPESCEIGLRGGLGTSAGLVVALSASPLGTPPGQDGLALSCLDVTALRRLEQHSRRNERLASLGSLAGGLLHEMRNPLASLTMALDLLRPLEQEGEAALLTERALAEGERLNVVLEDFRVFAGLKPLRKERLSVDIALDDALAKMTWPSHVQLERNEGCGFYAHVDRSLLAYAARNLLQNAIEAFGARKGQVRLSTGQDDDEVWIRVADDGPGIPRELLARVFEPMFTTKAHGSGLGLAIVQRVADAHGGRIDVGSAAAGGAEFVLRLPAA
jgi:two-component system, NtrC family, sensor histidine kinase PilS